MLRSRGFSPEIIKPEVPETLPFPMDLETGVSFLALKKALAAEKLLREDPGAGRFPGPAVILAADTVVYKDRVIGKPEDPREAARILRLLNGTFHLVATGVAILEAGAPVRRVFAEITKVFFRQYTEEDIAVYTATSEPYDKAGGYAIQGAWGRWVDRIEGDYDNVVGFPAGRIFHTLNQMGYDFSAVRQDPPATEGFFNKK